jgi:hypothetical protein
MRDIWGSSPTDVYVVGHNDNGYVNMFRFDGNSWKPVGLNPMQGGTIAGAFSLSAIHGFSANAIYAVGQRIYSNPNRPPNFLDSSLVIHFDGREWREVNRERQRGLTAIWGRAPTDLWTGGFDGVLYHFDGASFTADSLPFSEGRRETIVYSITGDASGAVYLLLYVAKAPEYRERFYFFTRPSGHWTLFDSVASSWRRKVWISPSGSLFTIGYGVYKRVGNIWQNMQMDALTSLGIGGTGDDNLFVVGSSGVAGFSGEAFHYNGTDWFQFKSLQLRNVQYAGIWTDGREVFIAGVTLGSPQKTIIAHGK